MKKFTRLMMLCAMTSWSSIAWGEGVQVKPIKTSDNTQKVFYQIKEMKSNKFVSYDKSNQRMKLVDAANSLGTTWYFEKGKVDGTYVIKNCLFDAGSAQVKRNSNEPVVYTVENNQNVEWTIAKTPYRDDANTDNVYYIGTGDINATTSCWNNYSGSGSEIAYWVANDVNSRFEIVETTLPTSVQPENVKMSNGENKNYYFIRNARTMNYASYGGADNVAVKQSSVRDGGSLWYLEGTSSSDFVLRNASTTNALASVDNNAASFTEAGAKWKLTKTGNTAAGISITLVNDNNDGWNDLAGQSVCKWGKDDAGSMWILEEASAGMVNDIHCVGHLSELSNESVYRIKSKERGAWAYKPDYISDYASGKDIFVATNMTTASDENQKFAILKSENNNYYIYNIAAKKFVSALNGGSQSSTVMTDRPTMPISFAHGEQTDKLCSWLISIEGGSQFAVSSWAVAGGLIYGYNDAKDPGNNMQIEKVGTFDPTEAMKAIKEFEAGKVMLGEIQGNVFAGRPSGYNYACTFSAPYATAIPENTKAYYASASNGQSVTLTEITEVIPANTGVILLSNASSVVIKKSKEAGSNVTGNLLVSSARVAHRMEANKYVLALFNGNTQFYAAKLNSILGANKAYLQLPTAEQPAALSLDFGGEATGIENVATADDANAPIYDLSGRRVSSTVKGGIYIQNGKKFIVK